MSTPTTRMIPTHRLRFLPPAQRLRSAEPSKESVDAMAASLRERGQLQPIVVTATDDDHYVVIFGETRARGALQLKWREIRAELAPSADPAWIAAAQLAENTVRTPIGPVEKWRAMQHLLDLKFTAAAAAATIGVSERQARKLARLGQLHPTLLAAIEKGDMPDEGDLQIIASATLERQAEVLKDPRVAPSDADPHIGWDDLAVILSERRMPRSAAIFDVENSGVVFEEDLFAPADEPEAYTDDCKLFLELLRRALDARVLCPPKGVTYSCRQIPTRRRPARV